MTPGSAYYHYSVQLDIIPREENVLVKITHMTPEYESQEVKMKPGKDVLRRLAIHLIADMNLCGGLDRTEYASWALGLGPDPDDRKNDPNFTTALKEGVYHKLLLLPREKENYVRLKIHWASVIKEVRNESTPWHRELLGVKLEHRFLK